jgi:hypothetical protein
VTKRYLSSGDDLASTLNSFLISWSSFSPDPNS